VNGTYGSFSQSGTASASSSHALSVALPFNHSDRDAVIRAVDLVCVRDISGIEGVRVRYERAGVDSEVVLPWSLTVEPKQ